MKKSLNTMLVVTLGALVLSACRTPEPPTYTITPGEGGVRYSPERGIYREGTLNDQNEEALYQQALRDFEAQEYDDAQEGFHELRTAEQYVDGARALDAVVREALSALEKGKSDTAWRLEDLANAFHGDLAASERIPSTLFEREQADFLHELAFDLNVSEVLDQSWEVTLDILIYYVAGLGVVPDLHMRVERHARNLAWYAYLAGNYELAEDICRILIERDPNQRIKAQTQMILADTSFAIGYFVRSRDVYGQVYKNSRDPDIKEDALLGEIRSILATSKGWEYDITPYEDARKKIEQDYKLDLLQRFPSKRRRAEFLEIEQNIHQILYRKYIEQAETFERLFEEEAKAFYLEKAREFREYADEIEASATTQ